MSGKSVRTILVLGVLGCLMLTFMMLFSLDQLTDSATPQIAAHVHDTLARSLARDPATTRVSMVRDGQGVNAPRRYVLRLVPASNVAAEPKAVETLLRRAAEIVVADLEGVRADVSVDCTAELAGGDRAARLYRRVSTDDGWSLVAAPEEERAAIARRAEERAAADDRR